MDNIFELLFNLFAVVFMGLCVVSLLADELIIILKDIKNKWEDK